MTIREVETRHKQRLGKHGELFWIMIIIRKLNYDTSSAQSFKALKSFFTYVDDLEHIVNKKRLDEKEFREALNQLTGLQVSAEESEFIFRMLDANKDGLINTENELKFSKSDDSNKWSDNIVSHFLCYIASAKNNGISSSVDYNVFDV